MLRALIDKVHMRAPMIPKVLEYDRNREDRSIFSVACARSGKGLLDGSSILGVCLAASPSAGTVVFFFGGDDTSFVVVVVLLTFQTCFLQLDLMLREANETKCLQFMMDCGRRDNAQWDCDCNSDISPCDL